MANFCTKCGNERKGSASFCTNCGAKYETVAEEKACDVSEQEQRNAEDVLEEMQSNAEEQAVKQTDATAEEMNKLTNEEEPKAKKAVDKKKLKEDEKQAILAEKKSKKDAYKNAEKPVGRYAPTSFIAYFGMIFLFAIPVVGWIACLVMCFACKKQTTKNFARASMVWSLILAIVFGLASVVFGALGFLIAEPLISSIESAIEDYRENNDGISAQEFLDIIIERIGDIIEDNNNGEGLETSSDASID